MTRLTVRPRPFSPVMPCCRLLAACLAIAVVSGGVPLGMTQERTLTTEQFEQASLDYRTALHYDSLQETSLDNLVRLYREADRIDELIGLYRSHTERYPDDAGAKAVLIQILNKEKREGAGELITSAVTLHPTFAALQYLSFQFLEEKGDPRALEALSKAIDLETSPTRRGTWLEELLQLSEGQEARKLAGVQLEKLLLVEGQTSSSFMDLAKMMQRYLFWDLSLEALKQAKTLGLDPEAAVEAEVMLASGLLAVGKNAEAAGILDGLLAKLAIDHWRRREILSMRVSVVATEEEREAIIARFRDFYVSQPDSETAAIDYAEILIASERQTEATKVLLAAASRLPASRSLESRALELIESSNDPVALEAFLRERLEKDPERSDLRFRSVKVQYALGKDAEAEQDFKSVVAGLEPAELSERILELQRYLRGIDRIDAAAIYLQRYVRNYPDRLDVARELAEIYLARHEDAAVEPLIAGLNIEAASVEAVKDLVQFLTTSGFFASARSVLTLRLANEPQNFELGLMLIEVLGELGDEAELTSYAPRVRELTDTPERYASWLNAAVAANTSLETLDRFFANEQARFSFDSADWPEDKVEKFILLCEAGKMKLQVESMATAVRQQLESGTLDAALKLRLRKFLVGMLEVDPAASAEVESQLKLLATEDSVNRAEYELKLALLYHRTQRVDLAKSLLNNLAFAEVKNPLVIQESVTVLIEYGFMKQAADALAVVNKLSPEDVFSWERRLTILASLSRETDFRAVIRQLRSGDAGLALRPDSMALLDHHLQASFWRSVSRLISTGEVSRFEETLPLLASVDREEQSLTHSAWTEWTRAIVLSTLTRKEEANEAMERLSNLLTEQGMESIEFPDGLSLAAGGARTLVDQATVTPRIAPAMNAAGLLSGSTVRWAFEAEDGARIEQFGQSGENLIALDNRGTVYSMDLRSGKLIWSERLAPSRSLADEARPGLFIATPERLTPGAIENRDLTVKMVRPFLIEADRFLLIVGEELHAYGSADGSLLWSSRLNFSPFEEGTPEEGARPDTLLAASEGNVIVFRPDRGNLFAYDIETGKQLWESRVWKEKPSGRLSSMNAGLDVSGDRVFAYGWQSVVLDAKTGKPFWGFDEAGATTFPVTLRKDRGEEGTLDEEAPGDLVLPDEEDRLIDFTSTDPQSHVVSSLDDEELAMVSPAVFWARSRLQSGKEAYGTLSDGFLWLMQDGLMRRLSLRLPVASRKLKASGTFVGVVKNHAWLLEGNILHHLDFNSERVSHVNLSDMGPNLRVVVSGNQLIVRGQVSARVINMLTATVIGNHAFPPELLSHVKAVADVRPYAMSGEPYWRGTVYLPENGEPRYCVPIRDFVYEDGYVTQFSGNVLVCLARPVAPVTSSTGEAAQ